MNQKTLSFLIIFVLCLAVASCYFETTDDGLSDELSEYFYTRTETGDDERFPFLGFDLSSGRITASDDHHIFRSINKPFEKIALTTFNKYKKYAEHHRNIVETSLDKSSFVHKRYITTYPFEWTSGMIKDAFLFNLKLALDLKKYGLLLIDPAPNNTVFDYTRPVFVDFGGILADDFSPKYVNRITNEEWKRYILDIEEREPEIFQKFAKAFVLLSYGKYDLARKMLMNRHRMYILGKNVEDNADIVQSVKTHKLKTHTLSDDLYRSLIKKVEAISVSASPHQFNYNYYKNKNENFDFKDRKNWKQKQNSIYEILNRYKPETVIDIGCNTGWFSILAERTGARVISIDSDEAVVDYLYQYSKEHNLNILPLKINFENLDKKYYVKIGSDCEFSETCKNVALYAAPILRLKSDMTFCLALVHHLVLHFGMSAEKVMNILARITRKVLVLEVPSLDQVILSNLSYYRYARDIKKENYGVECFINEGKKYFKKFRIYPSTPESRTIIVFEK